MQDGSGELGFVGGDGCDRREAVAADPGRRAPGMQAVKDQIRVAIDTIPGLVWTAQPDGYCDFLNQRWLEYTGLTLDEAKGWGWQIAVCPEDLAALLDVWRELLASGKPGEVEARLRQFDGQYRWFLFRAVPLHDELGNVVKWYGTTTDIHDRKWAEALLAGEKRLLEMVAKGNSLQSVLDALCRLVEHTAAGSLCSILLVETNGSQLRHGAAPSLPLSYTQEIDGSDICPGGGPCASAAFLKEPVIASDFAADDRWPDSYRARALAHGLRACWSTPMLSQDGTVLGAFATYYRTPRSPTPQQQAIIDQFSHLACIAVERAHAEDALRRSERQLRQAQRLEAMGTLAGGIAHDFNNILGAILGYGEMALRDAPRGSRLRRDVESIMTAGERGRTLVERILAFSRSGVGERVAVHVEAVVREALDLVAAKLPEGVTIEARLRAGRAAMLGDPTQVHQVLMNLATNAIQAMTSGGTLRVSLDVERLDKPRIATTGTIATGEYVVLEVADCGTGIPKEIIEQIFDPFFSTKEIGVGTGLGLSLVHGIVTAIGGAIDAASTVGVGSVFTVYLPRTGEAAEDGEAETLALPRGNREQILIVDDEEPLVRLATETLAELGYVPVGFTSSVAALEAFRVHPERFDAVITDERMPSMSGSGLIREMRGIRSEIPILLVTGYPGAAVVQRARDAGVDAVLGKPLLARELATSLARVLQPQSFSVR